MWNDADGREKRNWSRRYGAQYIVAKLVDAPSFPAIEKTRKDLHNHLVNKQQEALGLGSSDGTRVMSMLSTATTVTPSLCARCKRMPSPSGAFPPWPVKATGATCGNSA